MSIQKKDPVKHVPITSSDAPEKKASLESDPVKENPWKADHSATNFSGSLKNSPNTIYKKNDVMESRSNELKEIISRWKTSNDLEMEEEYVTELLKDGEQLKINPQVLLDLLEKGKYLSESTYFIKIVKKMASIYKNLLETYLNQKDELGRTALHLFIHDTKLSNENLDDYCMCVELLSTDANIDVIDNKKQTALIYILGRMSEYLQNKEILTQKENETLLVIIKNLKSNNNVKYKGEDGRTVLHTLAYAFNKLKHHHNLYCEMVDSLRTEYNVDEQDAHHGNTPLHAFVNTAIDSFSESNLATVHKCVKLLRTDHNIDMQGCFNHTPLESISELVSKHFKETESDEVVGVIADIFQDLKSKRNSLKVKESLKSGYCGQKKNKLFDNLLKIL